MKFTLDIQFFASKKGVSSTKNGRDSAGRRLGAKVADGQYCSAGSIILKRCRRIPTVPRKGKIVRCLLPISMIFQG